MVKSFSGGGILPIYIINKKPYFVMFSVGKGVVGDAGGRVENSDDVAETACREMFEESAGLIKINRLKKQQYVVIDVRNDTNYYRTHIILLDGEINLSHYYKNTSKIKVHKHNPFSETYGVRLISLDKLKIVNNNVIATTHDGHDTLVTYRASRLLTHIEKKYGSLKDLYKYMKKNLEPIQLKYTKMKTSTYEYTTGKKIKLDDLNTYESI